ncbi:sugar transferase [Candidatus Roizmanbacteria bacterium]|nr:sugar transferase [Candidatus Roizmanbacteria bacterium]
MTTFYYDKVKRFIDIVGAITLCIIFFPITILCAIAIVIDSEGPIFADTPERIGRHGKPFKMYKFRSMIVNAHNILRNDPKFKKLYRQYKNESYKLKNDPRVTRVGRFIRKHSIDEIPQLINVLRGEMSLVGPRAYYSDELREQQKKYPETKQLVHEVLSIKPGITGVWQVSGRSEVNFDKRIAIDASYARKKSIGYDILILLRTPNAMITGRGAV